MIIFSGLFTAFGRLIGPVATMTIAWGTILLFGRVPESKRNLLSFITLGSLAWVAALAGVLVPAIGGFLLAAVPRASFIQDWWLRLVMVALAIFLPLIIAAATVSFVAEKDRPVGQARITRLIKGYPYAAVYALTVISLSGWALERKIRSMRHHWESVHIPVIVKPDKYEAVTQDLESALRDAGFAVTRKRASGLFEVPIRLLARVGGDSVKGSIPKEIVAFEAKDLEVLVYPSDVALLGRTELVVAARAAVARRLASADAYLTPAFESQQIEDRLTEIAEKPTVTAADFAPIDDLLTALDAPYDEWETLYRLRLQVEQERRLPDSTSPAEAA
jgi:hypothetical protein